MPRKQKHKNKKTLKNKKYKNKQKRKNNKLTRKRNRKYNKINKQEIELLNKIKKFNNEKQKTIPNLNIAIKLIKNAKKEFNKNPVSATIKLTMASAIVGSYVPVQQKFDIGTLGEIRSGLHAPENPTTLVKYHDRRLNPNKTSFSQKELKILSKKYPGSYENIIPHLF